MATLLFNRVIFISLDIKSTRRATGMLSKVLGRRKQKTNLFDPVPAP
jgi:hypothetical protein